jgi:hypothetical protein
MFYSAIDLRVVLETNIHWRSEKQKDSLSPEIRAWSLGSAWWRSVFQNPSTRLV